jgi:hypothetical protein
VRQGTEGGRRAGQRERLAEKEEEGRKMSGGGAHQDEEEREEVAHYPYHDTRDSGSYYI